MQVRPNSSQRTQPSHRYRRRLSTEALEGRLMLASYQVNFATTQPHIDGFVDFGEWDAATAAADDFTLLTQDCVPDPQHSRFQLLWDADYLYILFRSDNNFWSFPDESTSIAFGGEDNLNFYLDPNLDGEPNDVPPNQVDGYQIAMSQRAGHSEFLFGNPSNIGLYFESHVDALFGDQGGWSTEFSDHAELEIVQEYSTLGGVAEIRIPWAEFDSADLGSSHPFPPIDGEAWYFNVGRGTDDGPLPVWSDGGDVFSDRPHGEIVFVGEAAECGAFEVTTVNDTGPCSLREAINDANSNPGPDAIVFNIPGPGPHTIIPLFPLPTIVDPLQIDGTTQPGYSGVPVIEINGSSAGSAPGFLLNTDNSEINGLTINGFSGSGIVIWGNDNAVQDSYIGTDVTGALPRGNSIHGIEIAAGGRANIIERNVISANEGHGIALIDNGVDENIVLGNKIGTDVSGTAALGNTGNGIWILHGKSNLVGGTTAADRNIISGNAEGVAILGTGATDNRVQGNYLGTDITGTIALGNNGSGVVIVEGASSNVIGTDSDGLADTTEGNLISGNDRPGVFIGDSGTEHNRVAGNYIGTNASGSAGLGNGEFGVAIWNFASNNVVGTNGDGLSDTAEKNVISGNASRWCGDYFRSRTQRCRWQSDRHQR